MTRDEMHKLLIAGLDAHTAAMNRIADTLDRLVVAMGAEPEPEPPPLLHLPVHKVTSPVMVSACGKPGPFAPYVDEVSCLKCIDIAFKNKLSRYRS